MFLLPTRYWHIRPAKDKGLGVFVRERISAGTVIGDYLGKVISLREYDPHIEQGMYLMAFGRSAFIYPDLSKPGIHRINHSCRPNAWMYVYHGHTLFFALTDIAPGEEITISYLLSPKDEPCMYECDHICRCGSEHCRGTMHLSPKAYRMWQAHLNKEKRKTGMAPYALGANLPRLSSYPDFIPEDPIYESIICDGSGG